MTDGPPPEATLDAHVVVRRPAFTLDVHVVAQPGEIVAVLGPNGAGKTTLLRCLAGLQPPDDGTITLSGIVVDDPHRRVSVAPHRRHVALVPQDGQLFPHLTARENVAFGPRAQGTDRRAARAQADTWLSRLGLDGLGDRRPANLSGGQAARVALARALATNPRLVLLDEPLAALDAGTRAQVRNELRRHLSAAPAASLLVTHDPLDAITVADRLIVIEAGRVVQTGTPTQVAHRPATDYVARLVGVNLWTGDAAGAEVALDGGGVLHLADPVRAGQVQVTVLPSAIVLSPARPDGSARNTWPGIITAVEILGGRARVSVNATPPVLAEVTMQAAAALRLTVGGTVWVSVKATELTVTSLADR